MSKTVPNGNGTGDLMLDSALRKSSSLVMAAQSFAFALDELGQLDIPPVVHGQIDQAQLKVIASLYLASELEFAGVIPAVEQLSSLGGSIGVPVNLGEAADLIANFWHHRNDRATVEDRREIFARLFGSGFDELMLNVCEALYKLDELPTNANYGGVAQQSRVRSAATQLLESLVQGGGGMTTFMAQEIVNALKESLTILGHQDLKNAFGARDVWGVVAGIDRMTKTKRSDSKLFVRRGRAGLTVLSWLAEAAPHLENVGVLLVALDHPVIPAAVDWIEAALAIGETGAEPLSNQAPQKTSSIARSSAPTWAALAS
jgi:hypothetical protein